MFPSHAKKSGVPVSCKSYFIIIIIISQYSAYKKTRAYTIMYHKWYKQQYIVQFYKMP